MTVEDLAALYEKITPRYPELRGQVAVVTGSGRNIGMYTALRFAREGMKVVLNALEPDELAATEAAFRALNIETLAVAGDLSRKADIDRLFDETLRVFGTVHVLVNNAADLRRVPFFEVDEALMDYQLEANIKGPFRCAYRAAGAMREAGGGSIIHISSVGGLRAHRPGLPYDLTKSAIDGLTRAMALDLIPHNIRVNAIAPGLVGTTRWEQLDEAYKSEVLGRIPTQRACHPLEIAAAIAFLASPEARYIVGQVIYVDAGLTIQLSPPGQPL